MLMILSLSVVYAAPAGLWLLLDYGPLGLCPPPDYAPFRTMVFFPDHGPLPESGLHRDYGPLPDYGLHRDYAPFRTMAPLGLWPPPGQSKVFAV